MKVSVIIPALNEESSIKQIVYKVLEQQSIYEIIVIDDGSTDDTSKILQSLKNSKDAKNKLKVFNHKVNKGKGAAIQTGLKKAGGDAIIIQDADLEYNPAEFSKLFDNFTGKNAVYGSRILGKNPHAYFRTYLGNVLISGLCNFLFGSNLTDTYTCYKLIPTKIAKGLRISSSGFELEAEITGKLLKNGVKIVEVPISFNPRSYEKGKKIKAKDAVIGAIKFLEIKFFES